jgi:hypothetical protein
MPDEAPSSSIKSLVDVDSHETSLIQNRLNVAGLAFTALFFSGSFSLSLHGSLADKTKPAPDYRIEFAHIEAAIALGVILCLLTVCSLLVCQQLPPNSTHSLRSRRLWFSLGTVGLYLTLSQALTAGLSEIVFGVARFHHSVGVALGVMATLAWVALVGAAPLHLIMRHRADNPMEFRILLGVYAACIGAVFSTSAEVYRVQDCAPATADAFIANFIPQFFQPLTWSEPWSQCTDVQRIP